MPPRRDRTAIRLPGSADRLSRPLRRIAAEQAQVAGEEADEALRAAERAEYHVEAIRIRGTQLLDILPVREPLPHGLHVIAIDDLPGEMRPAGPDVGGTRATGQPASQHRGIGRGHYPLGVVPLVRRLRHGVDLPARGQT